MNPWCLLIGLLAVPLVVGVWIGRWWLASLPLVLLIAGIAYTFTLSPVPGYEDPSRREQMFGIVLIVTLPMLAGALIGTTIGTARRRRQ